MGYTLNKRVDKDFDEVVESTISALEDEGFGVLCDIDVQATLWEKLDEDWRKLFTVIDDGGWEGNQDG